MNEQKTYVQAALAELKLACHPAMVPQVVALQKELDKELDQLRQRVAAAEERADKFMWQVRDTCVRAEQAETKLALAEQDARRIDWMEAHLCRAGEVRDSAGNCVKLARVWSIMGELETLRETIDAAIDASRHDSLPTGD